MFESVRVDAQDAESCADALVASVAARRRADAEQLAHVAAWADFHCPPDPGQLPPQERGRQRRTESWGGAEGTPSVTAAAAVELGVLLETTTYSAQRLLRDVLELRHRLPRHYAGVLTGEVEAWRAREVARRTHPLTAAQARTVDEQVYDAVTGLPWGRALHVIEAKVIAADPLAHRARLAEEENRRFVSTRRGSNLAGLRTLIARGPAGDIARLEAMVAHLAGLLAAAGDTGPADTRRAQALAMLANPALTCVFLAEAHDQTPATSGTGDEPLDPAIEPEPEVAAEPSAVELAVAFGRTLTTLGAKALERLRPRSVLYLHLAAEAVRGLPGTGVARVEDGLAGGPIGVDQLRAWLRNDRVTVRPVLDPTDAQPVDAYEASPQLREALRLLTPYEVFPYGTLSARRADADHTIAYVPMDRGGPPGQTRLGNLGPLGRRHHLAKTFDGFVVHQPTAGIYCWRTPTGHWYQVDHHGTRRIGKTRPAILDTSPAEHHFRDLILRHPAA